MKKVFKFITLMMLTCIIMMSPNKRNVYAEETEEETAEGAAEGDPEDWIAAPASLTYLTIYDGNDYYEENATDIYTLSGNIKAYFFSADGFLYISGSGDMPDYTYSSKPPWEGNKGSITDVKFESGITCAGGYLFYGYTALLHAEMPDSITKIGPAAFNGCTNLESIGGLPANLTYISDWAFYNCQKLEITETLPQGLTHIGRDAFINNYACMISDPLPDSIRTIDSGAFSGCNNLALSGSLPANLETIGGSAFSSCSELAFTGSLPGQLKSIGSSAFINCKKLAISGSLPQGLETLGNACFYGCENIRITGALPDSMTSMGNNIFEDCDKSKTHFNANNSGITIEALMKIPVEYYVEDRVKTTDGLYLGQKTCYGNALYSPRTYPSDRSYEGYEYLYPEDYSIYPTLLPNGGTTQTIYVLWDVEAFYTIRVPASFEFHYSLENERFEGELKTYVKGQLNCNKRLRIYPGTGTFYMWGDDTNTRIAVNAVQNISVFVDENPEEGQVVIKRDEETEVVLSLDTDYTVLDVYRTNLAIKWQTEKIIE